MFVFWGERFALSIGLVHRADSEGLGDCWLAIEFAINLARSASTDYLWILEDSLASWFGTHSARTNSRRSKPIRRGAYTLSLKVILSIYLTFLRRLCESSCRSSSHQVARPTQPVCPPSVRYIGLARTPTHSAWQRMDIYLPSISNDLTCSSPMSPLFALVISIPLCRFCYRYLSVHGDHQLDSLGDYRTGIKH